MRAFDFWWLCSGVTHPRPLSRGEVWDAVFLLVMSGLWYVGFPSGEGIEGCVMVRGAVWFEEFFEVVSVGFEWMFLIWVAVRIRHTPPAPLERGGLGCCVLVGNEWFVVCGIPL